jgi:hypothetical protein
MAHRSLIIQSGQKLWILTKLKEEVFISCLSYKKIVGHQLPKDTREIRLFEVLTSPPKPGNVIRKKRLIHSYSVGNISVWKKVVLFPGFLKEALYQVPDCTRKRIKEKLN